jgi:hypothetical protein
MSSKGLRATHSRILPVNVHAIEALIVEKLGDVACKSVSVSDDCLLQDIVSCGLRRISPSTKGDDALHIRKRLEIGPLAVRVLDRWLPYTREFGLVLL